MIEAQGIALVSAAHLAAKAGEPAPEKPFAFYVDGGIPSEGGVGFVRFCVDREELEKFALGALRLICDS